MVVRFEFEILKTQFLFSANYMCDITTKRSMKKVLIISVTVVIKSITDTFTFNILYFSSTRRTQYLLVTKQGVKLGVRVTAANYLIFI